jgi:hypothetical protein
MYNLVIEFGIGYCWLYDHLVQVAIAVFGVLREWELQR